MSTTQFSTVNVNVIIGEFKTNIGIIQVFQNTVTGCTKHFKEENGKFKIFKEFDKFFEYIQKPYLELYDIKNEEVIDNLLVPNESYLNHNDDLTIDSSCPIQDSKSFLETSNVSIAEYSTNSSKNTVPEPYAKIVLKNNVSQNEDSKKSTQKKDPKISIKKEDPKISTEKIDALVELVTKYVTPQHKHSIRFDREKNQICLTVNKDIRDLLLKLTESEIKLFETEINRICDKDIKYSIGPSTTNEKFTRVLKLHHALVEVSL
jgi:hypothetical protein